MKNNIPVLLVLLAAFTPSCSKEDDNAPGIETDYGLFDGVKVRQWYVENLDKRIKGTVPHFFISICETLPNYRSFFLG